MRLISESNRETMNKLKAVSEKHPVWFAVCFSITWFVFLFVIAGITSQAFGRPFEDPVTATIARVLLTIGVILLLRRCGWLRDAGITRVGKWWAWLLALGGFVYYAWASLYSLFGKIDMATADISAVPLIIFGSQFMVALSEEIAFRGLILYALMRAWKDSIRGTIGSVLLTSLLFAVLHFIQGFTLNISTVSLLVLQTAIVAIWWGALVQSGRSIWPVVLIHFFGNSIMGVQSLSMPLAEPVILAYRQLLWLSIPLGLLGLGLIYCKEKYPGGFIKRE